MSIQPSHNINFATFFGNKDISSGYSGLSVDFNTLVKNEIDSFTVNGNTVSINGTNLSVILPNSTAIGVDKQSGNWVINGTITDHRARGIDGNVTFDELSDDQRRQLSFADIIVNTINPGEKATATIIDNTSTESEFEPLNRTLSLSIPKGDRGDVLWADFMIDNQGILNMIVSEDYHGLNFTVSEDGYLDVDISDFNQSNETLIWDINFDNFKTGNQWISKSTYYKMSSENILNASNGILTVSNGQSVLGTSYDVGNHYMFSVLIKLTLKNSGNSGMVIGCNDGGLGPYSDYWIYSSEGQNRLILPINGYNTQWQHIDVICDNGVYTYRYNKKLYESNIEDYWSVKSPNCFFIKCNQNYIYEKIEVAFLGYLNHVPSEMELKNTDDYIDNILSIIQEE